MSPRRRRSGLGWLAFMTVLAVIAGVSIAVWRDADPIPEPESCFATVAGRTVELGPEQAANATLIAAIGVERGLPARAVSIALATAYQESKILNVAYGDRDSLGLFQQRPSQGWGTEAQVQDEVYATNAFYDALQNVDGYQSMRITEAAQRVQRSGFPEAYEDHAPDARVLASALTGYSGGGTFTCVVHEPEGSGTARKVQRSLGRGYGNLDIARTGVHQNLAVTVGSGAAGNRLGWSVAAYLVAHAKTLRIDSVAFDGKVWRSGRDSEDGWTTSRASATKLTVTLG